VSWAASGVLTVVMVAALAAWLVLGAIRRTARRQQAGLPPLPRCEAPARPLLQAGGARYLGTTYAPSPVRRFSGLGLLGRDLVDLSLDERGLRIDGGRPGPWCVPAAAVLEVGAATNHAGKVVSSRRVLVVDWRLGDTALRSGFVLQDETAARAWAERLTAVAGGGVRR
jgi:hypothetical protein